MLPSIAEWLEEPSAAAAVPDAGLVPRVRDAAPAHDAARSATITNHPLTNVCDDEDVDKIFQATGADLLITNPFERDLVVV